jgi:hypothetical protein
MNHTLLDECFRIRAARPGIPLHPSVRVGADAIRRARASRRLRILKNV